MSVPIQTTYTTPALSVRIAHPWRPPVWLLFVAAVSWRVRHVSPPSVERANSTGSDPAVAPEAHVADVGVAEVWARLGVVGPQLLLVAEQRLVLAGHDDRIHPGVVVTGDGPGDVVGPRHRDRTRTRETRAAREVRRDVGVVQALAVGPREVAGLVGNRAEHHLGVTVGHEVVLEVVGQRPDRTGRVRHAARIGRGRLSRRRVRLSRQLGATRAENPV